MTTLQAASDGLSHQEQQQMQDDGVRGGGGPGSPRPRLSFTDNWPQPQEGQDLPSSSREHVAERDS